MLPQMEDRRNGSERAKPLDADRLWKTQEEVRRKVKEDIERRGGLTATEAAKEFNRRARNAR